MDPSPEAIAWIRDKVSLLPRGWGTEDGEILSIVNAKTVANPGTRGEIPKPFTITQLMGLLDPAAIGKLRTHPSLVRILDRVEANDRESCRLWLVLLQAGGDITAQQKSSIESVLNATVPDPSWREMISEAERDLGRDMDIDDIRAARGK